MTMTELVTDALPAQKNIPRINDDSSIDMEVLKNVEKDLEDYEKLSLLFLILDDFHCFKEVYEAFCGQNVEKILSRFVGKINYWQTKFFEGLCITKAKKEIRMLGKSYEELERIYVPQAMTTDPTIPSGPRVHPGARLLFELFDNVLNDEQRESLLRKIYGEIRPPELKNDDPMEIHALYWMREGFISLSSDGRGNVQNLLKPLKSLGLSDHPTYLDLQKYSEKAPLKAPTPPHHASTPNHHNQPPVSNLIKSAYVIILNVITVSDSDYEDRTSSNVDVSRLDSTFRGLGYTVNIFNDPTSPQIKGILNDLKTNFDRRKHDGLIVCILSHGVEGHFVSHDGVEVPLSSIEKSVCVPQLQMVPKIVMVQACQGNKIGRAIRNDLVADGPPGNAGERCVNTLDHDRFLQFSSTMRECKAIRHKETGSWFINAVCDVFCEPRGQDSPLSVYKWTQRVQYLVKMNEGELEKGLMATQLPEVTYLRFTEDFYFPVYRGGS
ncbi:caspase-8 isoform X2 [Diachasma alloeum]|uniref:caspase-8 isoform X1 n=1 Tax=Diachasma alloeum TaxID=454923 RepID=UPI0007382FFB|nr:caspase-8 isoform X1 [Diachasma alloeum]XP_015126626.1 caspase-8 isoform X1 [Diachasma alloeum]XP_015126627.1 caspase-8 isoform X2 [Diachasma alloeum]